MFRNLCFRTRLSCGDIQGPETQPPERIRARGLGGDAIARFLVPTEGRVSGALSLEKRNAGEGGERCVISSESCKNNHESQLFALS